MSSLIDRYVDRVLHFAHRPERESQVLRREVTECLLQKVEVLVADGMPRGEAILEALSQHGSPSAAAWRLRGPLPWIDIRTEGIARGVLAIGPRAIGIFAFGGWAIGIFAFGFLALGVFAVGMISFGIFTAGLLTSCGLLSAVGLPLNSMGVFYGAFTLHLMESPDRKRVMEADLLAAGRSNRTSQPAETAYDY